MAFFWCEIECFDISLVLKILNAVKPATRPDEVQIKVILNSFVKVLHVSVQRISDNQ